MNTSEESGAKEATEEIRGSLEENDENVPSPPPPPSISPEQ